MNHSVDARTERRALVRFNRPRRAPRLGTTARVLAGATLASLLTALGAPTSTLAAWTGNERASRTLTAGSVSPVTSMTCTSGLLEQVEFQWQPPTSGLARTGYRWSATGEVSGPRTLAAGATSITLDQGLVGLGSGTFSLFAQGPGSWESPPATGSFTVLLDLASTCAVP